MNSIKDYVTEAKTMQIYNRDVVVTRGRKCRQLCGKGNKGELYELSRRALKRLAFVASNTDVEFGVMVTLTYPKNYSNDGKEVKYHLKKVIQGLKRKFDCSYLWWLEFQKRGAPHFHILLSIHKYSKEDISWLAGFWYKIVGSGDGKHLRAGTRIEKVRKQGGARNYVVKYAQKTYQKVVPDKYRNVGRFYGYSRDVKPQMRYEIDVEGDEDMMGKLGEWKYKGRVRGKIVSLLYNASYDTCVQMIKEKEIEGDRG